jgi:hypothetical protein
VILALLACKEPEGPEPEPEPETGDTSVPEPQGPGCFVSDNMLRLLCTYERDTTGPFEVQLSQEGESLRVIAGDPEATSLSILIWDLLEDTLYSWTLLDRGTVVLQGEVRTGLVPGDIAPVVNVLVDGPTSVDRVLLPFGCSVGPAMLVMDGQDRVRWYQEAGSAGLITGFDWTDRSTVSAIVGRTRAVEWDLTGAVQTEVVRGAGLERALHHAVVGRGGQLLALDAEAVLYPDGNEYVVDGIVELTAQGGQRLWSTADVLDPQGLTSEGELFYWSTLFPGAVDFGHANSIELWNGDWLLSLKHLDTVLRIDPDTGEVIWWLTGFLDAPEAIFGGQRLTLISSAGLDPTFQHQHHANPSPWGTLLLVDNGSEGASTRILDIAIDETAGTADVLRAWDLGVDCPVQSSAFGLPDGTVLATCARTREMFELDRTGIRRRVLLSCGDDQASLSFVRAQPISSWSQ